MTQHVIDIEAINYEPTFGPWSEEHPEGGFPPPFTWEVVCLGKATLADNMVLKGLTAHCVKETEKVGLERFTKEVDKSKPRIITWNGRVFDLPVLSYRGFHFGFPMAWYHSRTKPDYKYRFDTDKHFDVKDYISDFGQHRVSMDQAAKLIGLPGKMGVKGSDVAEMYAKGNLEDITAYCITDVLQTYLIALRMEFVRNVYTKQDYLLLVNDAYQKIKLEAFLEDQGNSITALGNSLEEELTLYVAKGCRQLINSWDIKKMTDV